jgi:hypothetical protein
MTEDTLSPLNNVITIDDERIKSHLDRVVRGSVEETLNAPRGPGSRRAALQPFQAAASRRPFVRVPFAAGARAGPWAIGNCQASS